MNYSNSQRAGVILYLTASLFGGYEEFAKDGVYYKTNRRYWRIINGEKYYYCGENDSGYAIWKDLHSMKTDTCLDDIKTKVSNIRNYM